MKLIIPEILTTILLENDALIVRYEKELQDLNAKISFYTAHNLEEEKRIAMVKLRAIDMIIYRWRKMYNEIMEACNQSISTQ